MFWSTFFADTEHLTEEAAKAHLFLLGHAWLRGAKLPDDDGMLARLCRIGPRKWASVKASVLTLWQRADDGSWTQKRMLREYDFVRRRVEANRKNGLSGGRPKSDRNANKINETIKANGFYGETQTNLPTLTPIKVESSKEELSCPKRVRTRVGYSEDFEAFWKAYPTDAGMAKKEAFTAWQRLAPEDRLDALAALPAWKAHCATIRDYRMLHACRYLSQRRFEGLIEVAERVGTQVFVKIGSPQWRAWEQALEKKPPVNKEGSGWWFKSEWPPNRTRLEVVA
jgi:uncharacterized protein YdaU (DUF1376 family)